MATDRGAKNNRARPVYSNIFIIMGLTVDAEIAYE
jgi:hypothetical protein